MAASQLLDDWYGLTPAIANEQLMREHASRTMQTARVRVVGAILEQHARERLGYSPDDKSAEGSIYRTVLERTGLHMQDGASWRFADPDEIKEQGLHAAWLEIAHFFRDPTTSRGKPLTGLINTLTGRPNGVPRAVLPLLIAAGYKRFARTVALYQDGIYLPDLLGFQFDQLVTASDAIAVRVEQPELKLINYLRELSYAFSHEHPNADDELFRTAFDAIARWRMGVPDGSKRTQKLDAPAKALLRAIDGSKDPVDLLLTSIPGAFSAKGPDGAIIGTLERARKKIDGLADEFAEEAMQTVAPPTPARRSRSCASCGTESAPSRPSIMTAATTMITASTTATEWGTDPCSPSPQSSRHPAPRTTSPRTTITPLSIRPRRPSGAGWARPRSA